MPRLCVRNHKAAAGRSGPEGVYSRELPEKGFLAKFFRAKRNQWQKLRWGNYLFHVGNSPPLTPLKTRGIPVKCARLPEFRNASNPSLAPWPK